MNILLLGDVVGRSGRDAVKAHLPGLRRDLAIDLAIVNAENAAHGYGLTERIAGELYDAGADILSTGNHVWDQRELIQQIDRDPRILRPANFPPGTPGAGWRLHEMAGGQRVLVVNLMGRLFMDLIDDPFACLNAILAQYPLGVGVGEIVVDFHAEATSEKMAFGHFADGRVSAVIGTHTHVPTADTRILPGGTAYQTDCGMTGPYESVIGVEAGIIIQRFLTALPVRMEAARRGAELHAVIVDVDEATGKARGVRRHTIGGD